MHYLIMQPIRYGPVVKDNFECEGKEIEPGWRVYVGGENYSKLFSSQRIRGPLGVVTKWTFQFALLSVIFSFAVGLLLSMILNKDGLKFQRIYRAVFYTSLCNTSICLSSCMERIIKS